MKKVYSLYDVKAEMYYQPFCTDSEIEAIRSFDQLINDSKTIMHNYPADFKLVYLSQFNQHDGIFCFSDDSDVRHTVVTGSELLHDKSDQK